MDITADGVPDNGPGINKSSNFDVANICITLYIYVSVFNNGDMASQKHPKQ